MVTRPSPHKRAGGFGDSGETRDGIWGVAVLWLHLHSWAAPSLQSGVQVAVLHQPGLWDTYGTGWEWSTESFKTHDFICPHCKGTKAESSRCSRLGSDSGPGTLHRTSHHQPTLQLWHTTNSPGGKQQRCMELFRSARSI